MTVCCGCRGPLSGSEAHISVVRQVEHGDRIEEVTALGAWCLACKPTLANPIEVEHVVAAELRRVAAEMERFASHLATHEPERVAHQRDIDWLRKRAYELDGQQQPAFVASRGGQQ